MFTTRRALFPLGALSFSGSLVSRLLAAEVWDQKPAAEWSAKDIDKLMNKSPWAKRTAVDAGRGPAAFAGPATARGDAPAGGGGRGGAGPQGGAGQIDDGAGGAPGGGGPGGAVPEALVRWESAKPILEAQKRELPAAFQGNYAVSISGFPLGGGPRPGGGGAPGGGGPGGPGGFNPEAMRAAQAAMFEKAKETTRIERKGKDPIHPSTIALAGRALVILFPQGTQPISLEDKDITLVVKVGLPELKVKFNLKDMVYQGKLEL